MKNLKYLFVVTLMFALFMVAAPVYAEQGGGLPCNGDRCSIKIEKVNEVDPSVVNPETLNEGDVLYAVSIKSNNTGTAYTATDLIFSIHSADDAGISNMVLGYIPSGAAGKLKTKYTSYNVMAVSQSDYTLIIGDNYSIIGYLVVKGEYSDANFDVSFERDYSNFGSTEVTLNGIKYDSSDTNAITADILFGDFRFNYILFAGNDVNGYPTHDEDGYWSPVNENSNKVIIDGSNSMSDLYCDFSFYGNSSVKMSFNEAPTGMMGIGDEASSYYVPESTDQGNESFKVDAGKTKRIATTLYGGDESVARNILKGDGLIGYLSLYISNSQD